MKRGLQKAAVLFYGFCRNCAKKINKLQNLGLTNVKTCDIINLALEMQVLIAQQDRATAF